MADIQLLYSYQSTELARSGIMPHLGTSYPLPQPEPLEVETKPFPLNGWQRLGIIDETEIPQRKDWKNSPRCKQKVKLGKKNRYKQWVLKEFSDL